MKKVGNVVYLEEGEHYCNSTNRPKQTGKISKKVKSKKKCISRGMQDKFLVDNANRMKNNPTTAELAFRKILKEFNLKFKEQVPFSGYGKKYILDFRVEKKWVVEIDGGYHMSYDQKKKDEERDSILQKYGYKVRRFTNDEVINYSINLRRWLTGLNGATYGKRKTA